MKVLIAGAGVAGCTLALTLQRAGIQCEIFEQSHQPGAGIALVIASNGVSVLHSIGLLPKVDSHSIRVHSSSFETESGTVLATADDPHLNQLTQTRVISRPALQQILEQAARDAGAIIHYGKSLTFLQQQGSTVTAHFADGTHSTGDCLIGADGIGSRVRQQLFPERSGLEYTGMTALAGISSCAIETTANSEQTMHFLYGRNAFFEYVDIVTPNGPGTLWWSTFEAQLESQEALRLRTLCCHQEKLLAVHHGWSPEVQRLVLSTPCIRPLAVHHFAPLEQWSKDRVVLIGDAAHAIGPHAGQASSIAMEDAFILGNMMTAATSDNLAETFYRFHQARSSRVDRVVAIGSRSQDRKTETSVLRHWLRMQALRIRVRIGSRRDRSWLLNPTLNI